MAADVEFGAINLPAVMGGHVSQSLGIELSRLDRDSESLNGTGNHIGLAVISTQRVVIILIHKDLKRLEHAENGFFANFATTPNPIFLRAHVEQRVPHQLFLADQYAGGLRTTDVFSTTESDQVEAEGGIFPEPAHRRDVGSRVVEGVKAMLFCDGYGFRTAHFAFVGENIVEMDCDCFWIDGRNHLFAGLDL